MSTERPILFSGPMVRAILDGRKTQTRRIVKPQPKLCRHPEVPPFLWWKDDGLDTPHEITTRNPYGRPGDRLWVKETFSAHGVFGDSGRVVYRADLGDDAQEPHGLDWKPSIFCTRKASRITLETTGVRVERLNDISEADAKAEGVELHTPLINGHDASEPLASCPLAETYREAYCDLWESINGAGSWAANPWVWVIEFRRI